MNKTVKIILIIIGCFFLLGLGMCGACYVWFEQNKEQLKAEGEKLRAEADAFAKTADQDGCLKETFRRQSQCDPGELAGAICRGKEMAFFSACLEKAAPTAGFCDDVPKRDQIMELVTWSLKRCDTIGRPGDQACAKTFQQVAAYCERKAQ